jgi:hypothetical protein
MEYKKVDEIAISNNASKNIQPFFEQLPTTSFNMHSQVPVLLAYLAAMAMAAPTSPATPSELENREN